MKRPTIFLGAVLLAASSALVAQSSSSSLSLVSNLDSLDPTGAGGAQAVPAVRRSGAPAKPLSRVSLGVGISPLGIGMQISTNLNQHFNLRGTGNIFNYSTDFTTNGINANAKLSLASAGAAVDIYPFHTGFRLSPGVLFLNHNQLTATAAVAAGTSFTLNNQTYYSANTNAATGATPVNGAGTLNLNTTKPAFTITTGWGNTIQRKGHWSFPVEVGVALIGKPSLNVNLGGWACYDQAQTICTDISSKTNPIAIQIQNNLTTQVAKWTSDLEPLKTYPIVSFGVAYSFRIR